MYVNDNFESEELVREMNKGTKLWFGIEVWLLRADNDLERDKNIFRAKVPNKGFYYGHAKVEKVAGGRNCTYPSTK
jgi:hypothetical protein